MRELNSSVFGSPAEALIVDRLRRELPACISLVADMDGAVVGHIMFAPVVLTGRPQARIAGPGPMAVATARQRRGIGSALVQAGLARCAAQGFGAVVVLGHPGYYPRFGFRPVREHGISCGHDVPAEAFVALELEKDYLSACASTVKYHAAYDDA